MIALPAGRKFSTNHLQTAAKCWTKAVVKEACEGRKFLLSVGVKGASFKLALFGLQLYLRLPLCLVMMSYIIGYSCVIKRSEEVCTKVMRYNASFCTRSLSHDNLKNEHKNDWKKCSSPFTWQKPKQECSNFTYKGPKLAELQHSDHK